MKQLSLLRTRRFAPFFTTQFFGAFNDNVLKNALVIMVAYQDLSVGDLDSQRVVALSAGIFILPFFLFSAFAGQLSDKLSKTRVIRWVKAAEIAIMILAAFGFFSQSVEVLLTALFLMGLHSTFFGPAKYSVLPELLGERELLGGNALIETGTFIAILLGTITGGLLAGASPVWISATLIGVAVLGLIASLQVPKTAAANPQLPIHWNPAVPMLQTYRALKERRDVYLSVLGISWFWFVGASILTLLPTLGKDVLGADEHVVTFFLSLFCIGIALGSLLCELLGGKKIELGLVPFGSIGLTIAGADLYFAITNAAAPGELATLTEFLQRPGAWRVSIDFVVLAIFGGLYTVPLYTLIQHRSAAAIRSRVIAANNILNAAFMVASALVLMALPALGLNIAQTFLAIAIFNALVAIYIYTLIPEFLLRFIAWCIAAIMYRIRVRGEENIPEDGPAVLVCNHVSYVDWLIVMSVVDRPIRFVGYFEFFKNPILGFLFRSAKAIPIAAAHEDEALMQEAFDAIDQELRDGHLVLIFPEGKLTNDGRLNPFKSGVEKILARAPVPVIPMALGGLWGSFFSRKDGKALREPFRRFWSRVTLTIEPALDPRNVSKEILQEHVQKLLSIPPR